MKIWWLFSPLLCICLLCDKVLLPWNFGNPGFDVRAPQNPPDMKYMIFGHILNSSYHIASLFYMCINMGERIVRKQYRTSLIIAGLPQGSPNSQTCKFHILAHVWKTVIVFAFCKLINVLLFVIFRRCPDSIWETSRWMVARWKERTVWNIPCNICGRIAIIVSCYLIHMYIYVIYTLTTLSLF